MAWTTVCELSELREGTGKYVEIDGYRLAVFLHDSKPYVMDNTCPHAGGEMSQGWIDNDGCAVCPWHSWSFDLQTGQLKGSQTVAIRIYPVRVENYEGKTLVQADLPSV